MDWPEEIWARWRVAITDPDKIISDPMILWTTRCCRIKSAAGGTPRELYRSDLPQRFLQRMADLRLPHAIVSDLYGLHFSHAWKASYYTAPSDLDTAQRRRLGEKIGTQARAEGFALLSFYNNSPIMSRPYFEILSHSGLKLLFHTRLPQAT